MRPFLRLAVLFSLFFSLLFAVGCSSRTPRPAPDDTFTQGGTTGNRGDYIASDQIYSEQLNANGLTLRDESSSYSSGEAGTADAFQSIYFGFDEYFVASGERSKLERVADELRDNPGSRAVCEGHTDWMGTVEYNLGLGDRRASSVKNFLVQLGIPANRIDTLSLGKLEATEGAGRNDSAAINERRVDVIIVD